MHWTKTNIFGTNTPKLAIIHFKILPKKCADELFSKVS